jgi:pyruvate dehydrogenase E2 component (dihydrolipoamide acetyltransferase)
VAAAIYRKPLDSKIFGSVELDVTELEAWVNEKRRQGLKITLMYPLLLWVARALKHEVPELNCYIRRGNVVQRPSVDVMVSVLMRDGEQMGTLVIPNADAMTIQDLAAFMARELQKSREKDNALETKTTIARIPWPLRQWVMDLARKIVIDWGIRLPFGSAKPEGFGSFVFSNIGSVGLDVGYPALLPMANVAMVLIMGSVNTKPAVVGNRILPRRILNLSTALDHRVVDAQHGGKLFKYLKNALKNPDSLM